MHYNISLGVEKNFYFLLKFIQCGDGDEVEIPEPSGTRTRFNFSSPLDMCRVTGKHTRIGYGDEECKTRLFIHCS